MLLYCNELHQRCVSWLTALCAGCLADPDTLLIWDGNLPRGQYSGDRAYVVLSSPNEDNFSDFIKGG